MFRYSRKSTGYSLTVDSAYNRYVDNYSILTSWHFKMCSLQYQTKLGRPTYNRITPRGTPCSQFHPRDPYEVITQLMFKRLQYRTAEGPASMLENQPSKNSPPALVCHPSTLAGTRRCKPLVLGSPFFGKPRRRSIRRLQRRTTANQILNEV